MAEDDICDWIFEGVLQFLRSPLWTTPVYGFIERHCHEFDVDEPENKLVYTELHNQFRTLVDEVLSSFLQELGVSPEKFVDAIKSGENAELSELVAEFLFALDDFPSFRALMEKKNAELELEAMYEYARLTSQVGREELDDMTDEERFLFEMAIQMSLGQQEFAAKHAEREDAELLHALALSVAIEQERLLRQQLLEDQAEEAAAASGNSGAVTSPPRVVQTRSLEEIQAEVQQQRLANAERLVAQQQQIQQQQQQHEGPAVVRMPPPPPLLSQPNEGAKKIVEKSLAPLAEKRTTGLFGARGAALPSIGSSGSGAVVTSPPPPPVAAASPPSFQELKQQAEAKLGSGPSAASSSSALGGANEPTKEELEQRAAYFKAQREKLLQQKEAARQVELREYKKQQNLPSTEATMASAAPNFGGAPPVAGATQSESDATREMRLALARRFKEDLMLETRRAAGGVGGEQNPI